jgi:hypothetical protein
MLQAMLPLIQSLLGGLLVIAGAIVGANYTEKNRIREEVRRNMRLDTAVRTEVLAHLRAESEQIRLIYLTAIVVYGQLKPIHERLVDKVFTPQTAQAFGGDAATLLDTVTACDSAFNFQNELHEHQPQSANVVLAEHEIRQVRGLWTRPFDELQAFFNAIGESDEAAKFDEARRQQTIYVAAGIPVPQARGTP